MEVYSNNLQILIIMIKYQKYSLKWGRTVRNLLNEFDEDKEAVINPGDLIERDENFPRIAVGTFSYQLMEELANLDGIKLIGYLNSANGRSAIYEIDYEGKKIAIFKAWVGAPACTGTVEQMIAHGVKTLVLFGTCGVLQKEVVDGKIIIPTAAIRDEGTSYHYAPASDEINLEADSINVMTAILEKSGYSYIIGKTWTTDAFYRETREKVERRKEVGAICVEMECAAITAVTKFRNVKFAQFLYAADNLDAPKWEPRLLRKHGVSQKEQMLNLALKIGVTL